MEHLLHLTLIFSGLAVGLVIWFWDSLRRHSFTSIKSLSILILIIFGLLHASGASLLMAYHHESMDHMISHPCCMPQAATSVALVTVPVPPNPIGQFIEPKVTEIFLGISHLINNRSPPIS